MMNKKQLIKWLREESEQASSKAFEEYKVAKEVATGSFIKVNGFDEMASLIAKALDPIASIVNSWHESLRELYGEAISTCQHSNDTVRLITRWSNEKDLLARLTNDIIYEYYIPEVVALYNGYLKQSESIRDNYTKLIGNVDGMKTAKEAIHYLISLGYPSKVFEYDETTCTAICAPVDTSFLHIPEVRNDEA